MDSLNLAGNQLTGSIPEEWSTMGIGMPGSNRTTMTALVLSDNSGLSGPLPSFFTSWQTHSFRNYIFETDVIRVFKVDGTNLCELDDSGFDDWFNKILAHPGVGFLGVPGVDAYVEVKRSGISCSDVSIDDTFDRAYRFVLHHNFPNPFNPVTTILFEIAQTDHVELAVYSVLGQRVALLINETMPAGKHQIQFNAVNLSSGLYIYRLQSANYSATRFMTLIK